MVLHWLPRLHWLEIHEQPWCPPLLRTFIQDYLRWMWETMDLVSPVVPIISKAVKATGATHIVDLCSGGGGPHRLLLPQLQAATGDTQLGMTLTDLYPHVDGWRELTAGVPGLRFEPRSVDATAVPPAMQGFRTLFTCLHHFPPQLVKAIVADAVAKGEGLGVFEITSRDSPTFFSGAIWMPLSAWLFPLLRRPFRLDYFFCANVVPLGPLVNMHDGLTSCLRTYSLAELRAIVESVPGHEAFEWEYGMRPWSGLRGFPAFAKAPYLIGVPKTATTGGNGGGGGGEGSKKDD